MTAVREKKEALGRNTNRIPWIDALRAIAMFTIVLGHTLRGESVYYYLYAFHVPLCVMISGFCFSKQDSIKQYCLKLVKREYLPYLGFSLLSIVVYVIMSPIVEGKSTITELPNYLLGMVYGNGYFGIENGGYMRWNLPLWYLPFVVLLQILAACVYKIYSRAESIQEAVVVFVVSVLVGWAFWRFIGRTFNGPFAVETVIMLFPFFAAGQLLKRLLKNHRMCEQYTAGSTFNSVGGVIIVLGLILSRMNGNVDYVCDIYGRNYLVFLIAAILISGGLFIIVPLLPNISMAQYFGKHTLWVLGLHKFPIMVFTVFFVSRFEVIRNHILIISILVSFGTIAACLISEFLFKVARDLLIYSIRKKLESKV